MFVCWSGVGGHFCLSGEGGLVGWLGEGGNVCWFGVGGMFIKFVGKTLIDFIVVVD